jgi:putative transposase
VRKAAAVLIAERFGLSDRRVCRVVGLDRATLGYQSRRPDDTSLRVRIRALAEERRRFGCPRVHVMLKREGWRLNHKKTERIYREEGLSLRLRRRKKRAAGLRMELPKPERPGQVYAMDFVMDRIVNGRRFKCFAVVDPLSKECPMIEVDYSITGVRVCQVLEQFLEGRQMPEAMVMDNGPEFSGKALDAWAYSKGIKLRFIQPGKPVQNAFAESFNDKLRNECLNEHWFMSLQEARDIIEAWRMDYNHSRPHSSLNDLTPMEFIRQQQEMATESGQRLNYGMAG